MFYALYIVSYNKIKNVKNIIKRKKNINRTILLFIEILCRCGLGEPGQLGHELWQRWACPRDSDVLQPGGLSSNGFKVDAQEVKLLMCLEVYLQVMTISRCSYTSVLVSERPQGQGPGPRPYQCSLIVHCTEVLHSKIPVFWAHSSISAQHFSRQPELHQTAHGHKGAT